MQSEKDILVQQEHYRDLLHEAEQERIIRQALERKKQLRLFDWARERLGPHFVAWAGYLQRRDAFGVFDGKVTNLYGLGEVTTGGD